MRYNVGDRVVVNMRNLNPDLVPPSPRAEATGTVVACPMPGLYHVRLDATIEGLDLLMDLGEDRLMAHRPASGA